MRFQHSALPSPLLRMICPQFCTCFLVTRIPLQKANVNRKLSFQTKHFVYLLIFFCFLVTTDVSNLMPRLFQLDATSDTFVSHEVVCPSRIYKYNCPFPVLQDDLYNVEQPGTKKLFKNLFLRVEYFQIQGVLIKYA